MKRHCRGLGWGLATALAVVASSVEAGPISSGDNPGIKLDNGEYSKPRASARNYDWTRPRPEEISPTIERSMAQRPYLKDVGPWSSQVELRVQASPPELPMQLEANLVQKPGDSRWTRPSPQEIVANPSSGMGARPYLRSVGRGIVLTQGKVRDYGSKVAKDSKQRVVTVVDDGTNRGNKRDEEKEDKVESGGGADRTDNNIPQEATANEPETAKRGKSVTSADAAKSDQPGSNKAPTPKAAKDTGSDSDEKDKRDGDEGARVVAIDPKAGGTDDKKRTIEKGKPGDPDGKKDASEKVKLGDPQGNEVSDKKDGAKEGAKVGTKDGAKDGTEGGVKGGAKDGSKAANKDGGKDDADESAGGPAGAGPSMRAYLGGMPIDSRERGSALTGTLVTMFNSSATPPPKSESASAPGAPPSTTSGGAVPTSGALPSVWSRTTAWAGGLWSKLWGAQDDKAGLSQADPSVRGDIR